MRTLDTGTGHLLGEVDDGVAVLTLNRPDRRNALSAELLDALPGVLAAVEADSAVGVVVLTGAGGAFCAGGDLKLMAAGGSAFGEGNRDERMRRQQQNQRAVVGRLWSMAKPTIAALPGAAAGAGLSLALACDLRYAAEDAVLTTAFANAALPGDFGGAWFLTRLVGSAKAKELYFFSERLDAKTALRLGLVNDVFPAGRLPAAVRTRARRLAHGPRLALGAMKQNLNDALLAEFGEYSDREVGRHAQARSTADHREAALAFSERRRPVFTDR